MTLNFNGSSTDRALRRGYAGGDRWRGNHGGRYAQCHRSRADRAQGLAATAPQTWGIELTDRVIDQTTGSAALEIIVDPNVEAGSKLYITLDPSIDAASNNVVIQKNANVQVYHRWRSGDRAATGSGLQPRIAYTIKVVNQLNFTANSRPPGGYQRQRTPSTPPLAISRPAILPMAMAGSIRWNCNSRPPTAPNDAGSNLRRRSARNRAHRVQYREQRHLRWHRPRLRSGLQELATGEGNDTLTLMRQGLPMN